MLIFKKDDTSVEHIQYLNPGDVFTLYGMAYILSENIYDERIAKCFCLHTNKMVELKFDLQVIHKPGATIYLDKKKFF